MTTMTIRPPTPCDLPGIYRICWVTADAGNEPPIGTHPDLVGHVYAGPYLFGPNVCGLVAVDSSGVAGYALGTSDTGTFEAWRNSEWFAPLRQQYPLSTAPKRNGLDSRMVRIFHEGTATPEGVAASYPAHFHIDLDPRAQGLGLGRALLTGLLRQLSEAGASGVHGAADPRNTDALGFYRRLGFAVERPRTSTALVTMRLDGAPDPA